MDRTIVYPGQNPVETDILNANKDAYLALSKVMESLIGQTAAVYGLGCIPTTPGSLSVVVQPGGMYQTAQLDASSYCTLGTDAHNVLKQGLLLDAVTLSCPTPGTAGYSINYLVQAQVLVQDAGGMVLPYYNSANPNQSFNGPDNSGTSQYTRRLDTCHVAVKAGTAAPSGSQITPSADAGFMPLFVVTVAYGATAINSGNIVQHTSAVFLPNILTGFATAAQGIKADNALPSASYTANDVLAKVKTVDGTGSGLDADTLDGHEASFFFPAATFAQSLATSGYQYLPGGLILQWGQEASFHDVDVPPYSATITFPIAFPTACFTVVAGLVGGTNTSSVGVAAKAISASGFTLYMNEWYGTVQNCAGSWFAIGH